MLKKVWNWIVSLFEPTKIEIEKIDEYITKQSRTVNEVRFTKEEERPLDQPLKKDEVLVGVDLKKKTAKVITIETRTHTGKATATPPKPLNEQLKGVELPSYAKGKTLPPKAKRQYIKQAQSTTARKFSDNPTGFGYSQVNHDRGGQAEAAVLGAAYVATTFSDDTSTYHSSSSSSSYGCDSSYDSSSYDSGSCSSSSSD